MSRESYRAASRPRAGRRLPCLGSVALAAITAHLLVSGCAEETTGVRVPNQPPVIRITSGPIEDSLHVYRMTFHWASDDPDGDIVGYEYTISGDTTATDSLLTTTDPFVALRFTAADFYDTSIRADFLAFADALVEAFGVRFVRLTEMAPLAESDFYDLLHTNAAGAAKITAAMVSGLRQTPIDRPQ